MRVLVCLAVLWALPAFAQLTPIEQLRFNIGLSLGPSALEDTGINLRVSTNGVLEVYNGIEWSEVGSGDVATLDDPLPDAFLSYYAPSNGYRHVYGPRAVISHAEAIAMHAAGIPAIYPGQLLRYSALATPRVFSATNTIDLTAFTVGDNSWLPLGTSPDQYWREFNRDGATGAKGDTGNAGLNGVGDFRYGVWQDGSAYDTNLPVVVSYDGQWWDLLASHTSSSGNRPGTSPGTNYWDVSVRRGVSGTIIGWTNIVDLGVWRNTIHYDAVNQSVWDRGNFYTISETNAIPPSAGDPYRPAVNSSAENIGVDSIYWTALTKRGQRGVQGPSGAVTNTYNTFYNVYRLFETNTVFENIPTSTSNLVRWVSTVGDDMTLRWVSAADVAPPVDWSEGNITNMTGIDWGSLGTTNLLALSAGSSDTNQVLRPDGDGGLEWGEPASDSVWLAASTNVVAVAGGSSAYIIGRFPVWDGSAWAQSDFVPASSTGSVSSVNEGVGNVTLVAGGGITIENSTNTQDRTITISAPNITTIPAAVTVSAPNWTLDLSAGSAQAFIIGTHVTNLLYAGTTSAQAGHTYIEIVRGTNSIDWGALEWIREPAWDKTNTVIMINQHRGGPVTGSLLREYNP